VFLVISVYFNLRNILPNSGTFTQGHPVVVLLTAFSTRVSLLSSKIHNGDDTAKDDTPKDDTPKDVDIRGLSGKHPAILYISRTVRVALM